MSEKVFTSIDDQIHLLESRGFLFDKESSYAYAKNILLRIGYYNLVNGYGRLFIEKMQEDGSPLYKQGTTIQDICVWNHHSLRQYRNCTSVLIKNDIKKLPVMFFEYYGGIVDIMNI